MVTMKNKKKLNTDEKGSLMGIFQHPFMPADIVEILEREIIKTGNSAKAPIPPKHIGRDCQIIIKNTTKIKDKRLKEATRKKS